MDIASRKEKTRPSGRVFSLRIRQAGFTIVELVVVMVLLAILAANAMPRFFAAGRFEAMGFAESSAAAARFARKLALNSRCDTAFTVGPGGYGILQRATDCNSGSFTRALNRPGGQAWAQPAPGGVAVGSLGVYFDSRGRPRDIASGTPLAVAVSYAVGGRTVTIEHETGFIHMP